MFLPNKVIQINNSVNKILDLPEKVDKSFTLLTKLTGATTGAAGVAKGSSDFLEAVFCQDTKCAIISAVGVTADSLQIIASFIPGPNVTIMITTPVSVGCKVFIFCCKHSLLPGGRCN